MLGVKELKERLEITKTTVECPVQNCQEIVERQRDAFKREDRFKCPKHNIVISTTSFEYQSELDNLLWKDHEDIILLNQIKTVKRESRIDRDTSEDAVTWNMFRIIEKNNLICDFLGKKFNVIEKNPEIIYWSYSQSQNGLWGKLKEAREEFELRPSKGSEPDIIIVGKNSLIIIEAKLTATNEIQCKKPRVENKYVNGGNRWWDHVFCSDFKTIAIINRKYELLRFWLIGTWMAHKLNLDFYLVNLVLTEKEEDIESVFKQHIKEDKRRKFMRITWEEIYHYISNSNLSSENKKIMKNYFMNKTIGYYRGRLKQAFSLPEQLSTEL